MKQIMPPIKVYMKYTKDWGYMSIIKTITDVNNTFLSRRELICDFAGLGGKLQKLEAVNMITKEFKLDGKVVVPIRLQSHMGKVGVTGTFYVYDDEGLAKKHINPTIFSRLEKAKTKLAEAQKAEQQTEETTSEAEVKAEDSTETKEDKSE